MGVKDRVLHALIAYENAKPRSQQVRLGPSELGGCREYVRNVMVGTPMQDNGDVWPTAAVVGTLLGAHLEKVAEEYMGAITEVSVTTTLPNGVKVTGHADIVLVEDNAVIDAKSKDQLHGVLREGGSLDNLVQVSVYTLGLVQAGVLKEGATAHLIYVDRSGNQQFLHEVELSWDDIMKYIEMCVERLDQVLEAQEHIDQGELEWAHGLRDKTPSFCYSKKVLCPFRDSCWKGSEWHPEEVISDPDIVAKVHAFVEVRDASKANETLKAQYREDLRGVEGVTEDGWAVTWSGSPSRPALYVTQVKEGS